jgi:arsenite methyltransferase
VLRRLASLILGLGLLGGCTAIKVSAYEGFGRDRWQRADAVVAALDVRSGDRIADVGAGSGYFTFRLADATGPNGRVYALDVDRGLVRHVSERARKTGTRHVIALRVDPERPELPEPVDLVFSCDVYHHLPDRVAYFSALRSRLRAGGRVAIVDFDGRGCMGTTRHHTDPETLFSEMHRAGYRLVAEHRFLRNQSFLIFVPVR